MHKQSNKKRHGLILERDTDTVPDSIRRLDAEALKNVAGGFSFVIRMDKSSPS